MQARTQQLILAALFAALTAVGAFIRIPLPLVPITLQTFFVLLSGFILGYFYGALSQVLYLIVGLIGFPVFAEGGGPGYVLKPTFGYLLGFPFAAAMVGYWTHRAKKTLTFEQALIRIRSLSPAAIFLNGLTGMLCIFFPGILYLYFAGRHFAQLEITFKQTLLSGFLIFLPGDFLKLLVLYMLLKAVSSRIPEDKTGKL